MFFIITILIYIIPLLLTFKLARVIRKINVYCLQDEDSSIILFLALFPFVNILGLILLLAFAIDWGNI